MNATSDGEPDGTRAPWKHWLGFLVSGGAAYCTDTSVSLMLNHFGGTPLAVARLAGISIAVVTGWLCHRWLTFAVTTPPSVAEFLRYASLAWMAAALNYVAFLVIIWLYPSLPPALAIAIAALIAMIASYVGMRLAVFSKPAND